MSWIEDVMNHPAVVHHGLGIETADLASFHELLMDHGRTRFADIGADQYAVPGGGQRFEKHSIERTAREFLEEVADAQNYLTMAAIKVLARLRALDG